MSSPTVSVVVPSYRRPALLDRCLTALARQTRTPDETIVVLRRSDTQSKRIVNDRHSRDVRILEVDEPGVLAAMRVATANSRGEIVAFTDDDAEPATDWLDRLVGLVEQPRVGAAGGRDVIPGQTSPRQAVVGELAWYGRLVGNHHLGIGPARDVYTLKGVNMAFRTECLAFPQPGMLRGDGAEVYFEVLCCRWATALGRRIVYDPEIEVAHQGAERFGLDQRVRPAWPAVRDAAHNFLIATTALDRASLPRQACYAIALGSRDAPGIGRTAIALLRREREVVRRFLPSLAGTALAISRVAIARSDLSMLTCAELRSRQSELVVAA